MTNENVVLKLLEVRYTGIHVPTRALVTASMMDVRTPTAEGKSSLEVALNILGQALTEEDRDEAAFKWASRGESPPPAAPGP